MKKTTIVLFLISVFFLSFLPVKDTDFGWHYRCGHQFLTTGKLCLKNDFSYFLPHYQAYNPSFLYDIALAFVYNHLGFLGVSFLGAIIFTTAAFFIFQLLPGPFWLKMAAFYLIFWLSSSIFGLGLRSQIVSFLFFIITLSLLTRRSLDSPISHNPRPTSLLLPLIFLVWVNTHIGFFVGIVLLLFFLINQLIVTRRSSYIKNKTYQKIGYFSFLILASFFTTLLNPFGPQVYREIFRHFQAPLKTMIAEWVAPPVEQKVLVASLSIVAFIWQLAGIKERSALNERGHHQPPKSDGAKAQMPFWRDWGSVPRLWRGKGTRGGEKDGIELSPKALDNHLSLFKILLLLFFTLISLQARRHLPFFYTTLFYTILSSKLTPKFINYLDHDRVKDRLINQLALSLLISLTFVFAAINLPQTIAFHQSWENYCQKGLTAYPCQALAKTNLKNLSGHLYTAYEWGGFLIWQTPRLKVFSDGRMSAWKDEEGQYPYQVYLYIIQARPGWNEKLKKYKTDYLLIGNGTFLDLELQKNAAKYGWKETYRDDTATFYQKI